MTTTINDWMLDRHAECGNEDFFPEGNFPQAIARAKAICRECPVMIDCLEWVMEHPKRVAGIVAGTTERNRYRNPNILSASKKKLPKVCIVCNKEYTSSGYKLCDDPECARLRYNERHRPVRTKVEGRSWPYCHDCRQKYNPRTPDEHDCKVSA